MKTESEELEIANSEPFGEKDIPLILPIPYTLIGTKSFMLI